MKLLRLIYILLSLAIADLGWLMAALAFDIPEVFTITPLLIIVGFLFLIGGVIISVVLLVSLIWLVIAYAPQLVEVPAGKIKSVVMLLAVLVAFNGAAHYALRPNPAIYKSQIVFKDPAIAVQDSMKVLRQLCESTEAKDFLSCYVRRQDSTLHFSVPVTQHIESTTENLGRIDTVTAFNKGLIYRNMKREDIVRLLSVIKFLNRNLIAGIMHDTSIGVWRYPYGMDEYDNGNQWIRYLYIYDTPKDTLKPSFNYYLTIKDRKEQMVLVGSNDVPYRVFR